MSELERFNVDSDLQSIADAMTIGGLNFCGGVFDHLETGEEFELTISKRSRVRGMADEIAELREMLQKTATAIYSHNNEMVGMHAVMNCAKESIDLLNK